MKSPSPYSPTRASAPKNPAHRAGFSLMELLMAITVLILIVMVLALVFQQTQSAWGTGIRRAGAETTLRGIMGLIERDLVHAVDDAPFGSGLNDFPSPGSSSDYIYFVSLDGTNRLPHFVVYKMDGDDLIRETYLLTAGASATNWDEGALASTVIVNGSQPLQSCTFSVPAGSTNNGLPLRVDIEAHIIKKETFSLVSGWSEGKNRAGHELEDMIVASP